MEWTIEAEDAIKKVPFFVRKKVRQRVEKEAIIDNKSIISIKEVKATQNVLQELWKLHNRVLKFSLEENWADIPGLHVKSQGFIKKRMF